MRVEEFAAVVVVAVATATARSGLSSHSRSRSAHSVFGVRDRQQQQLIVEQ